MGRLSAACSCDKDQIAQGKNKMAPPLGGVYSGSEAKGRRMIQNSVNQLFTFDNFDRCGTLSDRGRSGLEISCFSQVHGVSRFLHCILRVFYCIVPIEEFPKNHDFGYGFKMF